MKRTSRCTKKQTTGGSNACIQIGGTEGKGGQAVIAALTKALATALERGQNTVAIEISRHLASLGETKNVAINGCNLTMQA